MAIAETPSDWKNKALSMIQNDDEIMSLLDMTPEEADDPMYVRLFPYNHIPETIEETKVYITVQVSIPRIMWGRIWANPRMTIRVISHQDKMKLTEPGISATRIDYIAELIIKMFQGIKGFGGGTLELATNYEDLYNYLFHYRELVFVGEEVTKDCS